MPLKGAWDLGSGVRSTSWPCLLRPQILQAGLWVRVEVILDSGLQGFGFWITRFRFAVMEIGLRISGYRV